MRNRLIFAAVVAGVVGITLYLTGGFYRDKITIQQMLAENKKLKQAISNLTEEDQIGYAKVVSQTTGANGELTTTIKFVETERNDNRKKILERQYTIPGDVVHFDALIVKFDDKLVADGKKRAMYLWRRVYGETMAPQNGLAIESAGKEPKRYQDLLRELPLNERQLFWSSIWELANDPELLSQHGIDAIYGSGVYQKLRPGLIYVFKMDATGQFYPQVVPEM